MIFRGFIAAIIKEVRLLLRDKHGLALLFILPLAFILVMSLAMQDVFDTHAGKGIGVLVLDADNTDESGNLTERMARNPAFSLSRTTVDTLPAAPEAELQNTDYGFLVTIPEGFGENLLEMAQEQPPIGIAVSAQSDKRTELIFTAVLREAIGRLKTDAMLSTLSEAEGISGDEDISSDDLQAPVNVTYAYAAASSAPPSAVQQNVPAWLVFSIFFVAIPFSNTFIKERELGMQRRLTTTTLGPVQQFAGKLLPYFVVNQVQVALMLAVGAFIVPLLGGEALHIQGSPLALIALSFAISFAALGLALLISVVAATTEQATMTSGLGNIILAAIGGVMAPKFIMPEAMQRLAQLSPMSWGLDGFLELLLHNGGIGDIAGQLTRLTAFGLIALTLSWSVQRFRN